MDNSAHSSLYGLRLVNLLSELNSVSSKVSKQHFAENFGQLIGLSGSMIISKLHGDLEEMVFDPTEISAKSTPKSIKEEFLRVRTDLVRFIAMSFIPNKGTIRDKLPTPEALHSHFQLFGVYAARRSGTPKIHTSAYEPYRKFYVARQRDLEIRINRLRIRIQGAISNISPNLAQLSNLDAAFNKVLSGKTRDLFEVVPKLLGRHFGSQLDKYRATLPSKPSASDLDKWMQPGSWIPTFCEIMRELLLAELEVRLQPVLGMIDAMHESGISDRTFSEGTNI
jgi:hypothetical protein